MKIRLKISTPTGQTTVREYVGRTFRIGRDPSCEVPLEGDFAEAASRQHARIDLSEEGAVLRDLESGNGTQLNDKLIAKPMTIKPGDRIQIGYTGAVLLIQSLDSKPAEVRKWKVEPRLLYRRSSGSRDSSLPTRRTGSWSWR